MQGITEKHIDEMDANELNDWLVEKGICDVRENPTTNAELANELIKSKITIPSVSMSSMTGVSIQMSVRPGNIFIGSVNMKGDIVEAQAETEAMMVCRLLAKCHLKSASF